MKTLLLWMLFLASPAFSLSTNFEVCFTDVKVCAFVLKSPTTIEYLNITLKNSDYDKISSESKANFRKIGIGLFPIPDNQYRLMKQFYPKKIKKELISNLVDLTQISDEAWDLVGDSGACVLGVSGCVGTAAAAIETGGAALFLLELGCGYAVFECGSAVRSYQKWAKLQKKLDEESQEVQGGGGSEEPTTVIPEGGNASDEGLPEEICIPHIITTIQNGVNIELPGVQCYAI